MEITTQMLDVATGAAITVVVGGVLAFLGKAISKIIKTVREISGSVHTLLAINRAQTENIATLLNVERYMIRAGRNQNSALRELGANGSVTRANECLDEAERAMDGQTQSNDCVAMGTEK